MERELYALGEEPSPKNQIKAQVLESLLEDLQAMPECGSLNEEDKRSSKNKKKKVSAYQQFIAKCMRSYSSEIKGKPFGTAKEYLKKCTEEWKRKKTTA